MKIARDGLHSAHSQSRLTANPHYTPKMTMRQRMQDEFKHKSCCCNLKTGIILIHALLLSHSACMIALIMRTVDGDIQHRFIVSLPTLILMFIDLLSVCLAHCAFKSSKRHMMIIAFLLEMSALAISIIGPAIESQNVLMEKIGNIHIEKLEEVKIPIMYLPCAFQFWLVILLGRASVIQISMAGSLHDNDKRIPVREDGVEINFEQNKIGSESNVFAQEEPGNSGTSVVEHQYQV